MLCLEMYEVVVYGISVLSMVMSWVVLLIVLYSLSDAYNVLLTIIFVCIM